MLRVATAALLGLALSGCGKDEAPKGKPDIKADAAEPAADKGKKVGVACRSTDGMSEEERDAIHQAAFLAAHRLRDGDLEGLWESIHPQARVDSQRDAFTEALTAMQRRLNQVEELEVVASSVVDVRGGASALTRVRCGSDTDPNAFTLITNAGDEDVAVVLLRSKGSPFGYATTVQLRRREKDWRVLGIHVGLDAYRGRDAASYQNLADAYVQQQQTVEAYLILAVAQQLANRGGSLKLDLALGLADKVDAVENSKEFQQQLGVWEVGGRRYDIQGFAVTATQSDLSAVVRYVTPTGLIQEALDQEADALLGHLQMQHPELAKRFDAVVFEAYDSSTAASEAGAEVQAFRTPRVFPEPTAAG